uniref:Mitochondrial ribosomal protein S36 n=1 Tax=Panagrellus redivivus TaxID=6233 RepID=A0A7E4URG0_PANRE
MPTRTFKGAGSLQRLIFHNTPIRQIKPFDVIDLPKLKVILPERLAPRGFVPGQGAGRELRALIIRYGMPAPVRAQRPEQVQDEDYLIEEPEEPPNKRRRMNNRMSFIRDAKILRRIPTF